MLVRYTVKGTQARNVYRGLDVSSITLILIFLVHSVHCIYERRRRGYVAARLTGRTICISVGWWL